MADVDYVEVNMANRVKVREQEAKVRAKNFDEVCFGYNEEEAALEASRCLHCKNPKCVEGCPVGLHIPDFIEHIKNKEYDKAIETIHLSSSLPAICGRVCPQETQCESKCILGIKGEPVSIGKLERFTADYAREHNLTEKIDIKKNGKKVAIVGSGPAGLSCATDLAKLGYDVTIFEALHATGGVLTYGIPEFRLPKEKVVKPEVENVKKLGVKIETNVIIGKTITIEELMNEQGFEAVFIASGAGLPMFMKIPGENSNGIFSANEFLTRANLMKGYRDDYDTPIKVGKKVIVVGGGNVAMDAARTALRLGAETHIVYRRSEKELPARAEEVHHAKEEGVIFDVLCNPIEIIADDKDNVIAVKVINMELGEPDENGRRKPVEIKGSEHNIECDMVIMALGTTPNPMLPKNTKGLETNNKGCIVHDDETTATSLKGVFVGGDAAIGAATVILAMGAGKKAAIGIDNYLKNK
ncbi:MAG: NADPH-dependent glutamate synthase [Lachnospiraceae bacterium]|nr:NADPH-dependent glutamate synthase [Lachnospiraceae bacterium]